MMINIDTWEAGCKVRAFDWIDGKSIYLHMEYFTPGQSLSNPVRGKAYFWKSQKKQNID